jgi:hypothetical protein
MTRRLADGGVCPHNVGFQEGMPEDERDPEPLRSVFNSLLRFGCRKLPHQLNFRLYSLPFGTFGIFRDLLSCRPSPRVPP